MSNTTKGWLLAGAIVGMLLAYMIVADQKKWGNPPGPPSADAQAILDQLDRSDGWRKGGHERYKILTHKQARLTVIVSWHAGIEIVGPSVFSDRSHLFTKHDLSLIGEKASRVWDRLHQEQTEQERLADQKAVQDMLETMKGKK